MVHHGKETLLLPYVTACYKFGTCKVLQHNPKKRKQHNHVAFDAQKKSRPLVRRERKPHIAGGGQSA